ncbi:MAG TPA: PEGA domain-containing protein, partial [Polyangia bacterium]
LELGGGGGGGAATATAPTTTAPAATAPAATAPAATTPVAAPVAAVATAPEQIEVAIKSDPAGAQVVRTDGVVVGVTPVTMKLPKGSPALDVELTLDGYRAEKRRIASDINRELDVNLLKAPAAKRGSRAPTAEAKPAAPKPAEARPAAPKPAEARPAEAKPKEEKPADPDKELIPAQL